MLPLNFDHPVLDAEGNIHNLTGYIEKHGGGEPEPISDSMIEFTSDDTIQNPTERVSMPLFQGHNALKDLMRWVSKAFQNIRYILKYMDDISDDLDTTVEKVDDINAAIVKEWTDITVALKGEYYWHNNLIWKALTNTANTPAEGSEWHNIKVMDEVSELNSNLSLIGESTIVCNYTSAVSTQDISIDLSKYRLIAVYAVGNDINNGTMCSINAFKTKKNILSFLNSSSAKVVYKNDNTITISSSGVGIMVEVLK